MMFSHGSLILDSGSRALCRELRVHFHLSESDASAIISASLMLVGLFVAFETKRSLHPHSLHSNLRGYTPISPHKFPLIVSTLRTLGLLHGDRLVHLHTFPLFQAHSKFQLVHERFGFQPVLPQET